MMQTTNEQSATIRQDVKISLVVSLFFPRLMKNRRPSVKAATTAKPLHTPKIAQNTLNTKKANVSPLKIGKNFFIVLFFSVDVEFVISLPSRGVFVFVLWLHHTEGS